MEDENPYRSPGVSGPPAASARFEQLVTARLLEMRKQGFSLSLFYRWSWLQLILTVVYFGAIAAFLASLDLWNGCTLVLGILLGTLLRDLGWVRTQMKTWPIQERLMDWDKVQRMADGEFVG